MTSARPAKRSPLLPYVWRKRYLYSMLIPCAAFFLLFHYAPMYGVIIAFKDFNFSKGILRSPWVGLDNFRFMLQSGDFMRVLRNSLILSGMRIALLFPAPIVLAIMLNELRSTAYKRVCQTVVYLPYFISWVVIGSIIIMFLSPSWGVVAGAYRNFGAQAPLFMGKKEYFRWIVVISSIWKDTGWGTIIYLAALTAVSPELHEAAIVDGASRWHRILHVSLPCIRPTIVTLLVMNIGRLMNNGFEQIYVLQNNLNREVSEVFETYTYSIGLISGRFSFSSAVGLFTSTVGMVLILSANRLAKVVGEEGIY